MASSPDLSHVSDNELFQIAGVKRPDADLSKMSDKELFSELIRINGRLPPEIDITKLPDDVLLHIAGISPPVKDFGVRADGTPKGHGYFGTLKRPDGKVSTELSIGATLNGKETEIPSIVPTLNKQEIDYLLSGGKPTPEIVDKAIAHAKDRIAQGKSPFAKEGEQASVSASPLKFDATAGQDMDASDVLFGGPAEKAPVPAPSIESPAVAEYKAKKQPKGFMDTVRSAGQMHDAFMRNVFNEALMGLPEYVEKKTGYGMGFRKPVTTGESVASGGGSLVGFIIGAPGKVTELVAKGIQKNAPRLAITGAEGTLARAGKLVATEAPALGAGFTTAAIGEALSQENLSDAMAKLVDAYGKGGAMGATFGATRGVFPKASIPDRIKRLAVGITLLDAQRQGHPLDERELEQKVFDYGIDTFFLWRGMPKTDFQRFEREINRKVKEAEAQGGFNVNFKEGKAEGEEKGAEESPAAGVVTPSRPSRILEGPQEVKVAESEVTRITPEGVELNAEPSVIQKEETQPAGAEIPEAPLFSREEQKPKEPWEMTKAEWDASREGKEIAPEGMTHENMVEQALSSGKPVPPEVLKEYPGLKEKTPSGEKTMFDTGGYAARERTTPPMTEQERTNYVERNRNIVEMPEIVEIARALGRGIYPKIRQHIKRMGDGILGAFYPGKGRIRLKADIFKNPEEAAKVLAHEIGHMVDWLPDKDLKRGNILGRIASLKKYMDSLLEEYPGAPEGILTDADRARLKTEAESRVRAEVDRPDETIVREILKEVPKYEIVGITPEMVLDIMRGKVSGKEMAPDLYRFLQEADTATKKEIVKKALKDVVDERLAQFGERRRVGTEFITETETTVIKGKKATQKEIMARFKEMLKQEILRRKLYEKEVITKELKKVGQIWKPFDINADKKYTAYRHSSKELYADAFSVLLNDPALLKKEAPTFNKALFNFIERKPEVKAVYDEIQDRITNPETIMENRREFVRGMAEKGEVQRKRFDELRAKLNKVTLKGIGREIYRALAEKNKKWIEIERRSINQDENIADQDRISYWMEELPYIDSEVGNYRLQVEKDVFDKMKESDISMVDMHEYMELRRSATERAKMAGPGGIGGEFARKQLDHMKEKVGAEKFAKIEKLVDTFWMKRNQLVIPILEKADFLSPELMDYIVDNENYATFKRLNDLGDRIEKAYGDQVSAHIYKQLGTLGEVDNVFIQTVLKDMALIRAARNHQARMTLLEHLARYGNEGEITQAKRRLGSGFKQPRDADKGLLIVTPQGKAQGYYIDRELADTWRRNPDQAAMITRFVCDVCSFVRQLFVSKNVGWIVVNPIRDAMGTYKNLPKASIRKLTMAYIDTFVDAFRAGFGKLPEIEKKMLEAKMIVMDRQFRGRDVESEFAQEEKLLSYGTSPVRWRNFVLKPVNGVLNFLDKLGKAGERHGKFAGYRYLTKYEPQRGEKEIGHIIRTRVGTPNIYARGLAHNFTNNIYLFSNVNMQGYRASLESYKEAPGTYIYRTIAWNILPKAMVKAALAGFLGAELKEIFDKVPKYYRRMYNLVPLGLTPGGNAAILTLPQDYTGQVVGGIFDAILSGETIGGTGALGIATEQSPYNLNPILSTAGNIGAYYLLKANPINYHYAQNVLTEQEYKAGGMAAATGLAREAWNDLGGSMLWKWRRDHIKGVEEEIKDLLGTFPLNLIGRFIRVVNTGEKETARDITEKVAQEEAQKHLEVRDRIINTINEGKKSTGDMTALYRELKKEKLITEGLSVGQFRSTFERYATKSRDNVPIEAISQAGTNEQKGALLNHYKATMKPEDYDRIVRTAIKEGFISEGALIIMRKKASNE